MSARSELLGRLLAERRSALGYSLRQAVTRCEKPISVAYLQRLEKGEIKSPSPFVLHELAHALTIPYPTLMEAAGYVLPCGNDAPRPSELVKHMLDAEDLTEAEQVQIAAYLKALLRAQRELRGSDDA